jgi:hypothetical protein
LAGSGTFSFADGVGTVAMFNQPYGVAVSSSVNVFVCDISNNRIRVINSAGKLFIINISCIVNQTMLCAVFEGVVGTFAGSGATGFADGLATNAMFSSPQGVAISSNEDVYVADRDNSRIRVINSAGEPCHQCVVVVFETDGSSGQVTTLAGSGALSFADGVGTAAAFYNPRAVAISSYGAAYVGDQYNNRIRIINTGGTCVKLGSQCKYVNEIS